MPFTPYNPQQGQIPQEKKTGLQNFSTGLAKSELSLLKGVGSLGAKIGSTLLKPFGVEMPNVYQESRTLSEQNLQAENTGERFGKTVGDVAQFALPSGQITKTSNAVNTLISGTGKLKSIGRVLSKSAIEGVANAGVSLLQTGGDLKKAGTAGLIAGSTKGLLSGIGEASNSAKLPEKLYQTVFKNSSNDMLQELKTGALAQWQKTNPNEFKDLVKKGIIKTSINGEIVLNDSLAKEALDRGLRGSLRNMSQEVVKNLYRSEETVQRLAQGYKGSITGKPVLISIPENNKLVSLLNEISDDYKNVGGSFSDEAKQLSILVKNNKVDAENALKLRRFLDGMRIRSSFTPNQKLSQTQSNFKYFADKIRNELTKIPGFSGTMNEYRFNIDALDAIAKEAARRGNRQILGFIDSAMLGGGLASGEPFIGLGGLTLRRIVQSPSLSTKGAKTIQRLGETTGLGSTIRTGLSNLQNN